MKSEKIQNSYERAMDKDRISSILLSIKNIVHGFGYEDGLSDLEKLFLINDEVSGYNRNYLVDPADLENSLKKSGKGV
jgi:hypothetical protein